MLKVNRKFGWGVVIGLVCLLMMSMAGPKVHAAAGAGSAAVPTAVPVANRVEGLFPTPTPGPVTCNYTLLIGVEYVTYPETPGAGPNEQFLDFAVYVNGTCDQGQMQANAKRDAEAAVHDGFWYGDTFFSPRSIYRVRVILNSPS